MFILETNFDHYKHKVLFLSFKKELYYFTYFLIYKLFIWKKLKLPVVGDAKLKRALWIYKQQSLKHIVTISVVMVLTST